MSILVNYCANRNYNLSQGEKSKIEAILEVYYRKKGEFSEYFRFGYSDSDNPSLVFYASSLLPMNDLIDAIEHGSVLPEYIVEIKRSLESAEWVIVLGELEFDKENELRQPPVGDLNKKKKDKQNAIKTRNLNAENHFIVYFDILGYKSMINSDDDVSALARLIYNCIKPLKEKFQKSTVADKMSSTFFDNPPKGYVEQNLDVLSNVIENLDEMLYKKKEEPIEDYLVWHKVFSDNFFYVQRKIGIG